MLDPKVAQFYRDRLKKTGVALTLTQLMQHLAKLKIKADRGKVASFLSGETLNARFSKSTRPKQFQSIAVLRPGVYFVDYAEFHKSWGWHNQGNTGFLLAVENLTNRLFVHPCKTKETASWESAVEKFAQLTRNVTTILSDRDTVATSRSFRARIADKYSVNWYFLKKGSKSYLAERYIGFVKTKLSQALESREEPTKNWVQFVEPIVTEYNRQKIEGTPYSRQSVNANNFHHFLEQKFKADDPEANFSGFKVGPFKNAGWNRLIFKHDLGQKVLLARRANWKDGKQKSGGPFAKHSTVGGFGPTIYTISGRQLRQTKNLRYVAVYGLQELGPNLHFYDAELRAVHDG